jgi:hypothetical protein
VSLVLRHRFAKRGHSLSSLIKNYLGEKMRKILIIICVVMNLLACSVSQEIPGKPQKETVVNKMSKMQIDLLVKALNSGDFELLKPELSSEFRIPGVPESMNESVMSQVVSTFGKEINDYKIKSEEKGEFLKLVVEFDLEEETKEYDFLFDNEMKFVEINIFKAQIQTKEAMSDSNMNIPPFMIQNFTMSNKLITVEAEVDGKVGKFLVDSGAPCLVLNSKHFETENNNSVGSQGATGTITGTSYKKIRKFKWDNFEYNDIDVLAMDISHLEAGLNVEILGLISYEELKHFETFFDYMNKQMILKKLDANVQMQLPYKVVKELKFELKSHIPIFNAEIQGETYRLGLDTGAESNLFHAAKYDKLKSELSDQNEDELMGANKGKVTVKSGKLNCYKINDFELKDEEFVFSDISHLNQGYGLNIDGLIGYEFLHKQPVSINFRDMILKIYE